MSLRHGQTPSSVRGKFFGAHVRGVHRDVEVALHAELRTVLRELVVGAHLEVALFEGEALLALREEAEIALPMHATPRKYLELAMTHCVLAGLTTLRVIEGRKIVIGKL